MSRGLGDVYKRQGQPFDLKSMTDLRNLETIVMIEAQMVAFLNDFVFLVVIAFGAIPLVFLLRGRTKTN